MSFILQQPSAFINAKLTSNGRKLLAQGALTYDFWVFGDSEVDYSFAVLDGYTPKNNKILSPFDNNPKVKYPVPALKNSNSIFNVLPPITPIEQNVVNEAETRGFFTGVTTANTMVYSAFTSSKYMINGDAKININELSGNTTLKIYTASTYVTGSTEPKVGDYLLVGIRNPYMYASISAITATTNYTISARQTKGLIRTGETIPYLWYKIESINSGSLSGNNLNVSVDRNLPNFTGSSTDYSLVYVYPFASGDSINNYYGSGDTTAYWNNNTLSFESNCNVSNDNVPVWNMNIVFTENLAGVNPSIYEDVTEYGSSAYTGFKQYIGDTSDNPSQTALGIIHYTNHSISNYYAEGFDGNSLKLTLPTILWHKGYGVSTGNGNVIGLVLTASTAFTSSFTSITSSTVVTGISGNDFVLPFLNLVDNNNNIVGKVFNDLKTAVIEDQELLASLSYKSNRNWTLPTLNGSSVAGSGSNNLLDISYTDFYVTYLLACENVAGGSYSTPLHCLNYTKVIRGGVNLENISINFTQNQLPFMRASLTGATSGLTGGFTANKFYMICQKTQAGVRPDPNAWKIIDYTTAITNYNSWSATTINPVDLENTTFSINNNNYTGGSTYNLANFLTIPLVSEDSKLQFGDEVFMYGNLDTDISATSYKSSFLFSAPATMFNSSLNPTYSSATSNSVFLTEVGIYNSNKDLVAIGKFNSPIEKKSSKTVLIELSIDF